jgi:hypothetical protein
MVYQMALSATVLAASHGSGKHIPLIVAGCIIVVGALIFWLWRRRK